jgi:SP family sugar:H+ symporter-like MFS transporter
VGLFLAFVSNYFLAKTSGSALAPFWGGFETWRWMFWMELIPAFIFLIMLFFIPKSPRYQMVSDDEAGAKATLTKIFGADRAAEKVTEIAKSLATDHKPRLSDVMAKGTIFRGIVWVGIGLAVFQQLVGINVVFYYGAVLWQSVGFTESDALLINVLSGGLSIAAVLITLMTIDKIGRKPFLILGSIGMAVTLALVAFAFSSGELVDGSLKLSDSMGLLALIAANAYVFFFNMSWGPVMWVMLGEMFPNQIRGSGLAVAGFAQWITNFGITMTFPIFLTTIGLAAAYSIYAFFALLSVFFVMWFVRETRGKELEEMEG